MPKSLVSTDKLELVSTDRLELLLKDKQVVIAGNFYGEYEDLVKAVVLSEGGKIVGTVSDEVDYVIQGRHSSTPSAVKEAEKVIKSGGSIKIIQDDSLYSFLVPDERVLARLLKGGDAERFKLLLGLTPGQYIGVSLTGHDLSGGTFDGFPLDRIEFKACSFKNSTIRNSNTYCARDLSFEGARLERVNLRGFEDCHLKKAELTDLYIMDNTYRCDFSDTKFESVKIYGLRMEGCNFKNNRLRNGLMTQMHIEDCDFSSVDWRNLAAYHVTFSKCKFTNASIKHCWLIDCKFLDCDLSGCDLTGSNLALAEFTKSKIDGANFSQCILSGADTTNLEGQKTVGLKEALAVKASKPDVLSLQSVVQLSQEVRTASKYELKIQLETELSTVTCTLASAPRWTGGVEVSFKDFEMAETDGSFDIEGGEPQSIWSSAINLPSVAAAIRFVSCVFCGYRPAIETISVKVSNGQISAKEFHSLAIRAFCESFEIETPSDRDFDKMTKARKAALTKEKDELIALLRGGPAGVTKFNEKTKGKKKLSFKKIDLSGCDLTSVKLTGAELNGANLENCVLKNSILQFANLADANLKSVNLEGADCTGITATSANFSNATVRSAKLGAAKLQKTVFHSANCDGADLRLACITAADFSGARMHDTQFQNTEYNQQTTLPDEVYAAKGLLWCGQGVNPAKVRELLESTPAEPLDFAKFLERLEGSIDRERLKKAIKMLQAESFQLFSEVKTDQMLGVVKSQTDPDLVYSCLLTKEGKFCCGTQNLNSCGGLRGALCKHLLVLLIGLTKAGELDANDADKWARASKLQTPKMEKDAMSETFLRYKGAEAAK